MKETTVKCISTPPNTTYKSGEVYLKERLTELLGDKYFAEYMFTTRDVVDIYSEENYFTVKNKTLLDSFIQEIDLNIALLKHEDSGIADRLAFSTREAAQAYLEEQKKPNFEVGKVYKYDGKTGHMLMVTDKGSYGFWLNEWFDLSINLLVGKKGAGKDSDWQEATKSDWEEALIKEAERRYKLGDTIDKSSFNYMDITSDKKYIKIKLKGLNFEFRHGYLIEITTYDYVFKDGQWAEIIPQLKQATITEDQLDAILACVKEQVMSEINKQ